MMASCVNCGLLANFKYFPFQPFRLRAGGAFSFAVGSFGPAVFFVASIFLRAGDNRPLRGFATHREANTPSGARAERGGFTKPKKGKSDEHG